MGADLRLFLLVVCASLSLAGCRNEACEGSISLSTQADVDAVLDCTHFTQLAIANSELTRVELPNLETIERDLAVTDNARLASVGFPALVSVGGFARFGRNSVLSSIELSAREVGGLELHENLELETLAADALEQLSPGGLDLMELEALETLELPKLARIDASLTVKSNDRLSRVSLPALARVGGGEGGMLEVSDNARLSALELPLLAQSGWNVVIGDNARLTELSFPSLATAPMLVVSNNRALERLSAPALASVTDMLEVAENVALVELEFAALASAGCVYLHDNAALPDCEVAAVLEAVSMTCGRQSINNKGDGCP